MPYNHPVEKTLHMSGNAMRCYISIFAFLLVMLAGCGSAPVKSYDVTATAESNYAIANVSLRPAQMDELNQAERKWQNAGILNYSITVSKGNLFAGPQVNTIRWQHGYVVTMLPVCQTFNTPNCLLSNEKAEDYTVPGLFTTLRNSLNDPKLIVENVSYDPMYGLPRTLLTRIPRTYDSEKVQNVRAFTILP